MKKIFKKSKYNSIFETNNVYYVYNLISNSLVNVSENLFNQLNSDVFFSSNNCEPELIQNLVKAGIIIDADIDEIEYLKFKHNSVKHSKNVASFIIYPTLTCNFNCPYCFEHYKTATMSNDDVDRLCLLIKNQSEKVDALSVRWSGGEPLIVWDKIERMSNSFIENCEINNVKYISSIVTNGYLLKDKIAQKLTKLNITTAQVTLDGPPQIHNKKRFTKNDSNTFVKVIAAIKLLSEYVNVIIRVNIDYKNIEHFPELLSILEKEKIDKSKVKIFCKPIIPGHFCQNDKSILTGTDFLITELQLLKYAIEFGFPYSFHPSMRNFLRCPYYHINSFMIGPNSKVYKCPEYVGIENLALGYIENSGKIKIIDSHEFMKAVNYSPFDIDECKECKVLPICFGKCPILWEKRDKNKNEGCIPEKGSLIEKLKYVVESEVQLKHFKEINQWEN